MKTETIETLIRILDSCKQEWADIPEHIWSAKPAPGKWSPKQIIGHLIDSATNNHHRIIRAQFEDCPDITYNQNLWNEAGCYEHIPTEQLLAFWHSYNSQLIALIQVLPAETLSRTCRRAGETISLDFLIDDYVAHLKHHIDHIGIKG